MVWPVCRAAMTGRTWPCVKPEWASRSLWSGPSAVRLLLVAKRAKPESPPPALHALESEVMEVVWEAGEVNVRTTMDELNRRASKQRKYTTVMTVLARLHTKGLLTRHRQDRTDFYKPFLSREEYLSARAEADVSTLVEQYGEVALVNFARQMDRLDPKRRDQLRRIARRD